MPRIGSRSSSNGSGSLRGGSAIVYARSRRSTEELARVLRGHGVPARALPRRARGRGANSSPGRLRRRARAGRRRDDGIRDGHRQARRDGSSASSTTRTRSRATCRWSVAPGRDGEPSETLLLASPSDANARCGASPCQMCPPRPSSARSTARLRGRRWARGSRRACGSRPGARRARSRRHARAGRPRRARLRRGATHADRALGRPRRRSRAGRGAPRSRPPRRRGACGPGRRVRGESDVPPRAGGSALRRVVRRRRVEACDVCAPATRGSASISSPPPSAAGGHRRSRSSTAVASLTWPLGRRSLVATLRGSFKAPPSARRSAAYRLLAAATDADVRRWVGLLEASGALVETTTPDGFRVLQRRPTVRPPAIRTVRSDDVDESLVTRLRSWRWSAHRRTPFPRTSSFTMRLSASSPPCGPRHWTSWRA